MKSILYDILLIIFGMILILFRNFYAQLGQKGAKIDIGKDNKVGNQIYKWNATIVGAGFVLLGAYLLYQNLMKIGQ